MSKVKDVMVGVRVTPEMAKALEVARAKRGMRSVSAFCRWSVEQSLRFMGIHYGPAAIQDAPLFQMNDEIAARDLAPGQTPGAPEMGTPESNGQDKGAPEPKEADDTCDLAKLPELKEKAKVAKAKRERKKIVPNHVVSKRRKL